jgi:hypothetical protein
MCAGYNNKLLKGFNEKEKALFSGLRRIAENTKAAFDNLVPRHRNAGRPENLKVLCPIGIKESWQHGIDRHFNQRRMGCI